MNWIAKCKADPLPWLLEEDPANPDVRLMALKVL